MIAIKDFITKFNLKNIDLFEFDINEELKLEHSFLINYLGVFPGENALQILEAKLYLNNYFKSLKEKPLIIAKKEFKLIPSSIEEVSSKFIFNFTSVSTKLGISKKELNKFLKESLILISGQPSNNFPREYYQLNDKSIMLNYNGYDWIVKNYIYNNSETSDL